MCKGTFKGSKLDCKSLLTHSSVTLKQQGSHLEGNEFDFWMVQIDT